MTELIRDHDALSNWFNEILRGIAPRAISFCDIDRLDAAVDIPHLYQQHDRSTGRFLVHEFKWEGESESRAQAEALHALAKQPAFTVRRATRRRDGLIDYFDYSWSPDAEPEAITVTEFQTRNATWWRRQFERKSA